MAKLFLTARAPTMGAVLLVQHLMRRADMVDAIARIEAREGAGIVQRILNGEVLPCSELDATIAEETNHAVPRRAWRRESGARWFDPLPGPRAPAPRDRMAQFTRASGLPPPKRRTV